MRKSKHMKEKEKKKYKKTILLLIFMAIIFLLILCRGSIFIRSIDTNEKVDDSVAKKDSITVTEDSTIENEKLILKSNYEENKERKITYTFQENKLKEVTVFEKYTNKEDYDKEKEGYTKRTDIEIINTDDEQFIVYYQKLKLGSDEGLSYEQVYKKYMGIIGAYEVIEDI